MTSEQVPQPNPIEARRRIKDAQYARAVVISQLSRELLIAMGGTDHQGYAARTMAARAIEAATVWHDSLESIFPKGEVK